ncbi:C40 family peptidase [Endozoicomonas sp. SM1973]|uniref:C40 family peptidase n=1 Tax=Spartinivicinus marinus TaxID=2994442 RepID=A0A853IA53_9GAMM|nr:NlpC/P60 family protein [Spartinivicinus marinus]MCX4027143.1 NlpC/P60 family protein [Spartinivicinus marinus]NYZ66135.1 C40 family peptidase [Spartinivicinus marinus]
MPITQLRLTILTLLTSCLLTLLLGCSFSPLVSEDPLSASASEHTITKRLEQHYQHWQKVPYRYGGTNRSGIDCSSFVQQTYKTIFNLELPRSTKQQARTGKTVSLKNRRSGDLLFFKTSRNYQHVGIYLGNNRFLHVSKSKGVIISKLNQSYWQRHYWKTTRVL